MITPLRRRPRFYARLFRRCRQLLPFVFDGFSLMPPMFRADAIFRQRHYFAMITR